MQIKMKIFLLVLTFLVVALPAQSVSVKPSVTKKFKPPPESTIKKSNSPLISKAVPKVTKPGAIGKFYSWYLKECTDNPFKTKSITAAVVASLGDVMAQTLESTLAKDTFSLNVIRTASFFFCGLLYVGPFVHAWYNQLWIFGRKLEKKYGTSKAAQAIIALLLDQTIGVAIFFPSYFYVYEYVESILLLRMPSFARAHKKCMEQIAKVFLMQYRVFPLANGINFLFVPEQLRVLGSNIVSVFWNVYLCTLIAKSN